MSEKQKQKETIKLQRKDLITFQIDPFTGEILAHNLTNYPEANLEVTGEICEDENGNPSFTLGATLTFSKKKSK